MNEIWALTTFAFPPSIVPIMATMNSQTTIPAAPQMRRGRRPKRSTVQKETGVLQTLTRVVMREIRKGLFMLPRDLKKVVPK